MKFLKNFLSPSLHMAPDSYWSSYWWSPIGWGNTSSRSDRYRLTSAEFYPGTGAGQPSPLLVCNISVNILLTFPVSRGRAGHDNCGLYLSSDWHWHNWLSLVAARNVSAVSPGSPGSGSHRHELSWSRHIVTGLRLEFLDRKCWKDWAQALARRFLCDPPKLMGEQNISNIWWWL